MRQSSALGFLLFLALICCANGLKSGISQAGSVTLGSLFTGGAVLQRDVGAAVWGTASLGQADTGAEVRLFLDGHPVAKAAITTTGRWQVTLPPQPAAWHVNLTVEAGAQSASAIVSFGEVVLCSGQSNMGMPVSNYTPGGFSAFNGTAEVLAAARYTGKIQLASLQVPFPRPTPPWNGTNCGRYPPPGCVDAPVWNSVHPGYPGNVNVSSLRSFSALCWYTGKSIFERLEEKVPVGLMNGAVGGSPIEAWLPPGVRDSACGKEQPVCDAKLNASLFFNDFIAPFQPYTIGSVLWDQGERDVHCFAPGTNETAAYPCMQRALVDSWRKGFASNFVFVAVQLPGYIGDCDAPGANPNSTYYNCVPGVFNMRVAQDFEYGTDRTTNAVVSVTYDLSCPFGVRTTLCPFGSVHNVNKLPIAARTAQQILNLRGLLSKTVDGPRASQVTVKQSNVDSSAVLQTVEVHFSGGHLPLFQQGTQNCVACCTSGVGDFDVAYRGESGNLIHVNTTLPTLCSPASVCFNVTLPAGKQPVQVRYTANQGFPQCGIYNQEGFPAYPFEKTLDSSTAV